MASLFIEFSDTYEKFKMRFPKHPLVEELKGRISRGRFPNDEWLKSRIKAMKDLMSPVWARPTSSESETPPDRQDVA